MQISARRLTGLFVTTILFLGCAHAPPPATIRIDGSTPERFTASWDRMMKSLSPPQQSQLNIAILPIALGKYGGSFANIPPDVLNRGIGPADVRTQIDGMSFADILVLMRKQPVKIGDPVHQF